MPKVITNHKGHVVFVDNIKSVSKVESLNWDWTKNRPTDGYFRQRACHCLANRMESDLRRFYEKRDDFLFRVWKWDFVNRPKHNAFITNMHRELIKWAQNLRQPLGPAFLSDRNCVSYIDIRDENHPYHPSKSILYYGHWDLQEHLAMVRMEFYDKAGVNFIGPSRSPRFYVHLYDGTSVMFKSMGSDPHEFEDFCEELYQHVGEKDELNATP